MEETELKKVRKNGRYIRNFDAASSMTKIVIKSTGEKFTLFFSIRSPFSNFYPCRLRIKEENINGYQEVKIFTCTEQYYMYHKALSSYDYETALAIMEETEANRIKKLGRYVRNFDAARWEEICFEVMRRGNMEKYIQNSELRHILFRTLGTQMVECSPTDIVWGIGLDIEDSNASNPSTWRGKNRLGQILTEIRDDLSKRKEYAEEVRGALRYVEGFNEDAENFFNGSPKKSHLHVPSSVSFIFPFPSCETSSDSTSSSERLQSLYSTPSGILSAESPGCPTFLRQRRKRKSDEGKRSSLQRSDNSFFVDYEGLSSDVKHMKYKDEEGNINGMTTLDSRSYDSNIISHSNSKRSDSLDKSENKSKSSCQSRSRRSNRCRSSSRGSSNKSLSLSGSSDLPEKQPSDIRVENLDLLIGSGTCSESKEQNSSVAQISGENQMRSLNLKMSGERYMSLLARLRSKPCELWKQNNTEPLSVD